MCRLKSEQTCKCREQHVMTAELSDENRLAEKHLAQHGGTRRLFTMSMSLEADENAQRAWRISMEVVGEALLADGPSLQDL